MSGLNMSSDSIGLRIAVPSSDLAGVAPRASLSRSSSASFTDTLAPEFSAELPTTKKADAVAREAFDRAKASSKSYGIKTIHYGLILPLKKMLGELSGIGGLKLTDEQATNLDLYKTHKALCSGIKTVKKAYQQYVVAKKGTESATTDFNARCALTEERSKAGTLTSSYEELLTLATNQARGLIGVSETDLKTDLYEVLNGVEEGKILPAITTVREKFAIVISPEDSLQAQYVNHIFGLVEHIQQVVKNCGDTSEAALKVITQAAIDGLASIPELGGNSLEIIECYAQLVKLRDGLAPDARGQIEQNLTDHFVQKLNDLMNTSGLINRARLEEIQYNGIRLLSVIEISDKDLILLQNLKELKSQHGEIQDKLAGCQVQLTACEKTLTDVTAYPVSHLVEFLTACSVAGNFTRTNANTFETAPADRDLSTREGFKSYRTAVEELAQAQNDLKALNTARGSAEDLSDLAIRGLVLEEARLSGLIAGLTKTISQNAKEIRRLGIVKGQYHQASEKDQNDIIKSAKKADEGTRLYIEVKARALKKNADDQENALQAEIEGLTETSAQAGATKTEHEQALVLVRENKVQRVAQAVAAAIQYKEQLSALEAQIKELNNQPINLSGDDLRVLVKYLGIYDRAEDQAGATLFENKVYEDYATPRGAYRVKKVLVEERTLILSSAEAITQRMEGLLVGSKFENVVGYTPATQSFTVDAKKLIGEQEEYNIEEYVNSNLDIAIEVTLRAAEALIAKQNQEREAGINQVKLASAREALRQESAASNMLRIFREEHPEQELAREEELIRMIRARIAIFPKNDAVQFSDRVVFLEPVPSEDFEASGSDTDTRPPSRASVSVDGPLKAASKVDDQLPPLFLMEAINLSDDESSNEKL